MTKKHNRWLWFFAAPYILGLLLFFLIPFVISIYLSFTQYDLFNPPKWIGLKNYFDIFKDNSVWIAFRTIIIFALLNEGIKIPLACITAVFLNQKLKSMPVFRVIYFLPNLTPIAASAVIFTLLYNPNNGLLNYLLGFVGLGPFSYTYSANYFEVICSVTAMCIWQGLGYTTVFLLAGLQGISTDVMEAATIDGAGPIKTFIKITVPLLSPTIFVLMIAGIGSSLQVFDEFYLLSQNTGAELGTITGFIYQNVWVNVSKVGLGAAFGWVSFVFIAIFTYIQKKFENKWVYYE